MPYSVDGIGSNLTGRLTGNQQLTNAFVQSIGFSRSAATEAGASRLGADPATLQPPRLGLTPGGGDIRGVAESSFGNIFADAVANMQMRQRTAEKLGIQAVTGQLDDVHDYTIAAAESSLTMELTSAVRNKAVDMFNEIMRMQA
ncbi:MAG: flagellar hook-basal body complex protein FliE [Mobiluncus porci]|uniref:Flagellar hook-basal body complex protein FliE n=1 Tax=Mobiluncus porci TaxID=2652278 RepID=A0A7K0K3C8_9ACTO|nr:MULTISPECIES: flagellar hook-basal body complex protein FliE [Mobiluncus]MCI6584698.1 flagellar hook-basal body complex protein FliE [Mobiluncus sp.]MDD7540995.1 flagellar hook-basal body complex protein FliE [Mobiluncus porci]MDY5748170.1 flagellar hook-basal body complex protein FliE [Mobiluncus porci]MST49996.1 flagellar hook-basal body complex protein FliE [Mobiluncus porci]